jgi:Tfp pilus assembly PilM family ATPase
MIKRKPAMFKKSFVSIFFLPRKILAVQLSANKKRVIKKGEIDLPEGVIVNYKIADPKECAAHLKKIWSKFGFKEKTVGLVIPEFSTFTKLLGLPKLSVLELDEAIRWQVQEFLPGALEEMITDWQIVDRRKDGFDVLLVAVPKEVMEGYLTVCEIVGLFPQAIEIPSLALLRATNDSVEKGRLIVYRDFAETTIVLAAGNKIYASMVIHSTDDAEITNRSLKAIERFDQVKVEQLYLGGRDLEGIAVGLAKKSTSSQV